MYRRKGKKKVILIILALLLVIGCMACGNDQDESSGTEAPVEPETEAVTEEPEEAPEAEAEESSESSESVISPEFKKTMDDYEAWFDHYCEVMKKYEEDSTNLELLSETTELLAEETKMFEQMENMDQSEMTTAELAYYLEVTARIEKNLLEVAY